MHTFTIEPSGYNAFEHETALIEKCKEWNLLSEKASKAKAFFYRGNGKNLACSIIGYVDDMTAVIQFENSQKHCIHPSYLREMQAASYGQKLPAAVEELPETEGAQELTEVVEPEEAAQPKAPQEQAPVLEEAKIAAPKVEQPAKEKAKKGKLQLPEEKVKMTAIVKEFTTVPNHFSDTDDEVVIYEAVFITEPETEIGTAWSSHSATLKKMELEIGNKIAFEAKIAAKKLTKHPVPYKINNPAKIRKEES
ncbi:hypothetical protein KZ483_20540 [Paenibacillus sp. sptzw28]|uniref:hypothetical protein n=1 Tax=Paenibacillus sp. sptzw28 TaxID=715179 RepID=UPI001C6F37BE|nr:hypothetical protein [Paenibacillus sp. sptzw28]QYR20208.1 hypothetical protein KZ483_20540 [Paenibacillus sp. sptzw28]